MKWNLRSTYCTIDFILTDTKHRAASLRQQDYLCSVISVIFAIIALGAAYYLSRVRIVG